MRRKADKEAQYGPPLTRPFHFILFLFFFLFVSSENIAAQDTAQELKAVFIHHFCAYVTWPQAPENAHYMVGIVASHRTIRLVKKILEEKNNGACRFSVRRVGPDDDLQNLHILYVAGDSHIGLAQFRALAQNPAILTVSEEIPIPQRSIINFVIREDYLRFQISKSRADETGLKLSSQLLELADQVH